MIGDNHGYGETRETEFSIVWGGILEPLVLGAFALIAIASLVYAIALRRKLAIATCTIQESAAEQSRFQQYLEVAGAMIVVLEPTGHIRSLNRKGLQVLGTTSDRVLDRDWYTTFVPEDARDPIKARFSSLMSGAEGEEGYAEYAVVTASGSLRHTVWYRRVLRDDNGTVTGLLSVGFDDTERKGLEDELVSRALRDELTGLYNRRGFGEVASQVLALAARTSRPVHLFFADVDNLKDINDEHGHPAGDAALIAASQCLRDVFRSADVLARVGGDEFAALAMGGPGGADSELFVRVQSRLGKTCAREHLPFEVSMSLGIAEVDPEHPDPLGAALALADRSMYASKRGAAVDKAPAS